MAKKAPAAPKDTPPGAPDASATAPGTVDPSAPPASTPPPASETTQKQADAGKVNGLRVTAKREGFRRAGRAWSMSPTEVLLAELSDTEIALLKAETMLAVEEITLP